MFKVIKKNYQAFHEFIRLDYLVAAYVCSSRKTDDLVKNIEVSTPFYKNLYTNVMNYPRPYLVG